jgi:hypothetical protein
VIETSNLATDELRSLDLLLKDQSRLLGLPSSASFENISVKLRGILVEG